MVRVFKQIGLCVFLFLCGQISLIAQTDVYKNLNDPYAISYIDSLYPQHFSSGIGLGGRPVDKDNFRILAQDTGSGVITHIWMQLFNAPDSIARMKLWIDDKLVTHTTLYSFFLKSHGVVRPPLDTIMSGGLVCDLQMVYHKNFKITFTINPNEIVLFWGIQWKPIPKEILPQVFTTTLTGEYFENQKKAEAAYYRNKPIYPDIPHQIIRAGNIAKNDTVDLGTLSDGGVITQLALELKNYSQEILDSMWLQIFWDGHTDAAVNVPVGDFFLAGDSVRNITSYYIHSSLESGFKSFIPMPFTLKAQIRLINVGKIAVGFKSTIEYTPHKIDVNKYGYFFAHFNSILKAKYKVYHRVVDIKGRGKYIGTLMAVRHNFGAVFLEGNIRMHVDSMPERFIDYTGAEDYFNGGWYFIDGPFALPFAGSASSALSVFYRFHCLDAIDFENTLNIELEHGKNNDAPFPYRTVALYYKQYNKFWVDRDTVRAGHMWTISGNGYLPNEYITAKLDEYEVFSKACDSKGSFTFTILVPHTLQQGIYNLSVNNEHYAPKISVLEEPVIYFKKDSLPASVRYQDSLYVIGEGFTPNENVQLYIRGIHCATITIDSTFSFKRYISIPLLDSGYYTIQAINSQNAVISSLQSFYNTRVLNYEFEDIFVMLALGEHGEVTTALGYWDYEQWSQQLGYFYSPPATGSKINFIYYVPVSDTFKISAFLTIGSRYGDYRISIDSISLTEFNGYADLDFGYPIRSTEIMITDNLYLAKGPHTITFESIGRHPKAFEYSLMADNLILKPVTAFKPEIIITQPDTTNVAPYHIFPNPFSVDRDQYLYINVPESECLVTDACEYTISCFTLLGELVFKAVAISSSGKVFFPLGNLPIGTYFCTFKNEGTGVINTYPLIITD